MHMSERESESVYVRLSRFIGSDSDIYALSLDENNVVRIALLAQSDVVMQRIMTVLHAQGITEGYRFVSQNGKPLQKPVDRPDSGLDAMLQALPPEKAEDKTA